MSTTFSIREAQAQLPDLIARAASSAEPLYIEENGQAIAVLVSVHSWEQRVRHNGGGASAMAEAHEQRVGAYQRQMEKLGPEYWLAPEQQARLKELVERQDSGEPLDAAEQKELGRLLKRHEQLLIKRAAAMLPGG